MVATRGTDPFRSLLMRHPSPLFRLLKALKAKSVNSQVESEVPFLISELCAKYQVLTRTDFPSGGLREKLVKGGGIRQTEEKESRVFLPALSDPFHFSVMDRPCGRPLPSRRRDSMWSLAFLPTDWELDRKQK